MSRAGSLRPALWGRREAEETETLMDGLRTWPNFYLKKGPCACPRPDVKDKRQSKVKRRVHVQERGT